MEAISPAGIATLRLEQSRVTQSLHDCPGAVAWPAHAGRMKMTKMWRDAARWLRGRNGDPEAEQRSCCVAGCQQGPTLTVAGDASGTSFMCVHHAVAWSESSLCSDVVQHNSKAGPRALALWLDARRPVGAESV